LSVVGAMWPQVIAWPTAVIAAWIGLSWMSKAWTLRRGDEHPEVVRVEDEESAERIEQTPNPATLSPSVALPSEKTDRDAQAEVGIGPR